MRRRLLLPALFCLAALLAGLGWLTGSESGLRSAARLAESASGGQLQIIEAQGSLRGPLDIAELRWQSATLHVVAQRLHLDWRPAALSQGRLDIAELSAASLDITTTPSDTATPAPADLQLPLAVSVEKVTLARLGIDDRFTATDLAARLSSDGRQHHLDAFRARTGSLAIHAEASLDGRAPLPLTASAEITGQYEQQALALSLTAAGPLARLAIAAVASRGMTGNASLTLTPFADAAFASARLQLAHIDPAIWQDGAPQADLDISADLRPQADGVTGSFGLRNHKPGPVDRQRLPLATLAGSVAWLGSSARFEHLHATLPGGGELSGNGSWREGGLELALAVNRLDLAQIASILRPSRLNGQLAGRFGADRQHLKADLKDAHFTLLADASLSGERLELAQLQLSADTARLNAHGELRLTAPRRFSAEGELNGFDPSRFARLPAARLNASFKAAGRLETGAGIDASLTLRDSQIAGQAISGQGSLAIAWPTLPRVELQLDAGRNHLTASGAFGRAGDTLHLAIAAPQLAPYGLDGGLSGQFDLSGRFDQPRLAGQLKADTLGLPGSLRLTGLNLQTDVGGDPAAPLRIDLAVARLDTPAQTGLLRQLRLRADGSNQAHRLTASAEIAGQNRLNLAADGGLNAAARQWRGWLRAAELNSADPSRNVRLAAASALQIAADGWSIGPAELRGTPLDWQATVQADSTAGQAQASLSARGSRIGQIDGSLRAATRGAWTIDPQGRWQGQLKTDIADLGWLAELIGDGWQSEGRLNGELQLAGTPAAPLTSGRFRGEKLALRLPEQGLNLARGELDIDLRDNLVHIRRLGFDSLLQPLPRALRLDTRDDLAALTRQPGRLDLAGEIRLGQGQAGDSAWLDVRLDRLGAFQLPDQWVALSGQGRLSLQDGTLGATGKLTVDAGYWQLAPGGTPRLSDDVIIKRPGTAEPGLSLRPKLAVDISTDLGSNFLFSGAGLSSHLAGAIRISAQGRDLPRASGSIRTRNGRFEAYGQKLEIERGTLNFNGLLDNPGLDVRAVRKGLAVEPGVQIGGTAQRPIIKLISDPELPEAEKLAWLVLGHGPEQIGAGDATLLLSAASGLLGNDSGNLVQHLKNTLGVDEFGLRQGTIGDTGSRAASSRVAGGNSVDTSSNTGQRILSVGKRLGSNAQLAYEQTLGKAESVVKLTVQLSRRIAVVGRAGSDNALDVFYTLSFGGAGAKTETP